MAIIWCGGEDIDFPNGATPVTATAVARTAYARVRMYGGICNSNLFTPITTGWFSCYVYYSSSTLTYMGLDNLAEAKGLFVQITSSAIGLARRAGSTFTTIVTTPITLGTNDKIDMHIEEYSATGRVKLYQNRTLVLDYTGDLTTNGPTNFDNVAYKAWHLGTYISLLEFIVADEDTRMFSLKTIAPNANGDVNEWSGAYTAIDETAVSDADTIYTDQADRNFQTNLTGMPAGDFIVKAVKVTARATDGVGGLGMQMGIKTNGSLFLSDPITLDSVWKSYDSLYTNNPATANRFTPAEIEALQIAFKSVVV
jgi:hypothetical protein